MTTSEIDSDEIRGFYLALPDRDKQIFLAFLSNSLTIDARGFLLDKTGDDLIRGLRGLNELQHQISQHICSLGLSRERYPEEVLWNIFYDQADTHGIRSTLERSLQDVRHRSVWGERNFAK